MTGVLLINMGSPSTQKEMKQFLFNMFCDAAILPFPKIFRVLLAFIISNARYKKSWKKYELIGGSPLKESMNEINISLANELGSDYLVDSAYSYSLPTIKQGVTNFQKKGIQHIFILPMYPQSSFSTSGSIHTEIEKLERTHEGIQLTVVENFSATKNFTNYWVRLIRETIEENKYKNPILLFSAHAIPIYQVEMGDTYVQEINASARNIATEMGLPHKVSFQSKIGKVKWVDPDTKDCLKGMKTEGRDEIIIVPISFINENLETLFDLDVEIIPYGKTELNIKNICRVNIPSTHPLLIETLKNLIIKK